MANILVLQGRPDTTGGPKMAYQYAVRLHERGHRVTVLHGPPPTPTTETFLPDLEEAGIDLQFEPTMMDLGIGPVRRIAEAAREAGADVVVAFNQRDRAYATLGGALAGAKVVASAQNHHQFAGGGPVGGFKRLAFGALMRRYCDLAVCTSEVVKGQLVGDFRVDPSRVEVVPNGVDVRGFRRASDAEAEAVRSDLGVAQDDLLLATVGRIDPQKGFEVLLPAFARLKAELPYLPLKLVIVGGVVEGMGAQRQAAYWDTLRALAAAEGIEDAVVFAGWRSDVPAVLTAADVYVHSARWEGFSLATVEAMAASLPVVLTDCSGRPPGLVDGVHGFVVPVGDAEALAEATASILRRGEEGWAEMGGAARALALETYDIRVVGDRFVDSIERLLAM